MRWNETCALVAKSYAPDSEGVPQPTDTKTEVFCNPFSVGANTWSSMYEIGISEVAEIEVRTCDYEGQRDAYYRDKWYSVEVVTEHGDFTRLVMRHQQSDSDDSEQQGQTGEEEGGTGETGDTGDTGFTGDTGYEGDDLP